MERGGYNYNLLCTGIGNKFYLLLCLTTPVLMKQQKIAYVFSIVGYALGLGVFFAASLYEFDFKNALLVYSIGMSVFYMALSSWYFQLISKFDKQR